MAVYPSTNPYPQYEHVTIQRWKTLISNFDLILGTFAGIGEQTVSRRNP